jgi:hypothetical protein
MNAEQYRALVAKLEKITEVTDAPVAPAVQTQASSPTAPAGSPVIDAPTFSQAYAIAKKQGLKKFKWCGEYMVKDAVKPQPSRQVAPVPAVAPNRQFNPNIGNGQSTGSLDNISGSDLPIAP